MTVSSTNRKAGPYAGNGLATSFAFHFRVFAESDVVVVRTDSNGAETILSSPGDYSVTLNLFQEITPGGTVNTVATPGIGELITLTSSLQYVQPLEITNQGGFHPKVINAALDRLTILCQQLAEQVGRAVKIGISSSANPDEIIAGLGSAAAVAIDAASSAGASAASAVAAANSAAAQAEAAAESAAEAAAVTPTMVADGAVSAPEKLANGVVTTEKLANNAVSTAKMAREGSAGQVLVSGGPGANPGFSDLVVPTIPVGAIIEFTGNTPPSGFLKANGALISRSAYAGLWSHAVASGNVSANDGAWVIGGFSPGDGATTFRIPDLRGEFIRGLDDGRGVDSGRAIGTSQSSAIKQSSLTNITSPYGGSIAASGEFANTPSGSAEYGFGTYGSKNNITLGSANETRPRNVALLVCIKY